MFLGGEDEMTPEERVLHEILKHVRQSDRWGEEGGVKT